MTKMLAVGERELHLVVHACSYRLVLHKCTAENGGTAFFPYPDVKRHCKNTKQKLADLRQKARNLSELTDTPYREDPIYVEDAV